MPEANSPGSPASKVADTGLNCLIQIGRRFGTLLTVEDLRRASLLPAGEPSVKDLARAADKAGFRCKLVEVPFEALPELVKALPAILPLTNGTYLLLSGINFDTETHVALVEDPTAEVPQLVPLDAETLSRVWDGQVLLVRKDYRLRDMDQPFGIPWLVGQLLRERRLFTDIAVAAMALSALALVPAFFFLVVIDKVLPHNSLSTLNVLVAGLFLVVALDMCLGFLRRSVTNFTVRRVDSRLSVYMFHRVLNLPIDYFERNPKGQIAGHLAEIFRIRQFMVGPLFTNAVDLVSLVFLLPAILILSWHLTLFVLALTGLMALIILTHLKGIGRQYSRVIAADTRQGAYMMEALQGMRTVKSLALGDRKRHDWDVLVAEASNERLKLGEMTNLPTTYIAPIERLLMVGVPVLASYMIIDGGFGMTIGTVFAFNIIAGRVVQPLVSAVQLINQVEEVRGAIDLVGGVLNTPSEAGRSGGGVKTPIKGELSFQNVEFSYEGATGKALDRVSFDVPQGTIFGIMGRSGSGKTTVTRLLQGLHQRYGGLIKVDGMDIRQIDLDHLRRSIGVVLQENFLFSGTIRENICGARLDATFDEVVRAARMAGAEEFIDRLPRGYETVIEEGAANLSGGQRQRLAIARCLILDPPILLLDEATSALDAESEAIVNANLMKMAKGRTLVVISHRLSMLVPADQIMVMEQGKVYDIGKHDELLERCDIYRNLWFQQNHHMLPNATNGRPEGARVTAIRS